MSEKDTVSQSQCDERIGKVYVQLGSVNTSVAKILGGIAVASFVIVLFIGGAFYHINYRFSDIEAQLDGISEKIENI